MMSGSELTCIRPPDENMHFREERVQFSAKIQVELLGASDNHIRLELKWNQWVYIYINHSLYYQSFMKVFMKVLQYI